MAEFQRVLRYTDLGSIARSSRLKSDLVNLTRLNPRRLVKYLRTA